MSCATQSGGSAFGFTQVTSAALVAFAFLIGPLVAVGQSTGHVNVASTSIKRSIGTVDVDVLLEEDASSVRMVLAHPLPSRVARGLTGGPDRTRVLRHDGAAYLRASSADAVIDDRTWSATLASPSYGREWRVFAEVETAAGDKFVVDTGKGLAASVLDPQDTNPPTLGTSSVEPATVDITSSDQTVTARAQLLDDDTGVGIVFFNLRHTTLDRQITGFASLVSGTGTDGIWQADIALPQYSANGSWAFEIESFDNAFNFAEFNTGLTVTVTGTEDITPPTLSGPESLSPNTIDLSAGPVTVTITMPVQDDVAGATFVDVTLQKDDDNLFLGFADLVSGTAFDGTWELATIIQTSTAAGTWTLVLRLGDGAGNTEEIITSSTLTVSGGDSEGPTLSGAASIDPTTVNVALEPQTITITAPLQDVSGVAFNNDILLVKGFDEQFVFGTSTLISGTPNDGVWEIAGEVPTDTPNGLWNVSIEATDIVGNSSQIDTGLTLEVMGADTSPPQLVSLSVTPLIVDVSTGPADVDVSAVISDNQSGAASVQILWAQGFNVRFGGELSLTAGDGLSGTWSGPGTVAANTPDGVWGVSLLVEDVVGNSALIETGTSIQVGGSDEEPPVVSAQPMPTPTLVDVTSNSQVLTVAVGLTDGGTGVEDVRFTLDALQPEMSGKSGEVLLDRIVLTATLMSGSANDGIWEGTTTIPRNARAGDWSISLFAEDGASNILALTSENTFEVVGGDDIPPALSGAITIDKSTIDLSAGPVSISVTAPLVDSQSGVFTATIQLARGVDRRTVGFGTLVSGTAQNGVWRIEGTVPQSLPAGTWNVLVDAADFLGNRESIETGISVDISGGDTSPPGLTSVSVNPGQVDVTVSSAEVNVEAVVTDNLSGVSSVSILLQKGFVTLFGGTLSLTGGNGSEGTWTGTATVGQGTEGGIYTVLVDVVDVAGNRRDIATNTVILVGISDVDPPALGGPPVIVPSSVNVSTGPVETTVSASVTDGEAGVGSVVFTLALPAVASGKTTIGPRTLEAAAALVAGDQFAGTWSADVSVPQNAEPGDWVLSVRAHDRVGNILDSETSETLTVSGSDPNDPVYSGGGSLTPDTIDGTDGPGAVVARVNLTDDNTGVASVLLEVRDGGGAVFGSGDATLEAGTSLDGTWKADLTVDADGGSYDVFVVAADRAGNSIDVKTDLTLDVTIEPPAVPTNLTPLDGELQVGRGVSLAWTSRGARQNQVFLWRTGDAPATLPLVTTKDQRATVTLNIATEYSWFVRASNAAGQADSPTWTFKTESLPDLVITDVSVAADQQIGQPLDIEWTVQNAGDVGTTFPVWFDAVVLSFDQVYDRRDTGLGRRPNASYLEAGESYTTSTSFDVPADFVGSIFFIIVTDIGSRQDEIDETNNQWVGELLFVPPPPSDLIVTSVGGPSDAFSGTEVNVQWGVQNTGDAATSSDKWVDRIYLSPDSLLNGDSAIPLLEVAHQGVLTSFDSYNRQAVVRLPVELFGSYWLVAEADAAETVFEGVDESNNFLSRRMQIALTPPPDLVVADVEAPGSAASGQPVEVSWTVKNEGASQTAGSWVDRVYLSSSDTFDADASTVLTTATRMSNLNPTGEYRQTLNIPLPNGIQGDFFLFVRADSRGQIFEHTFEGNNVSAPVPIRINLSPAPDLAASNLRVSSEIPQGAGFDVSWGIANDGNGDAIAPWADVLVISASPEWTPGSVVAFFEIAVVRQENNLPAGSSRQVGFRAAMPAQLAGTVYLYLNTDRGDQVFEGDGEANNLVRSGPIMIAPPAPADLSVQVTEFPAAAGSGEFVEISWIVTNTGGLARGVGWRDAVYLSDDSELGNDILLDEIPRVSSLGTGMEYTRTLRAQIPNGISGDFNFIVQADASSATSDANRSNNADATNVISITAVPPPNLEISGLTAPASPFSGQPIDISWTVRNIGVNSTPDTDWSDAIYLSRDATPDAFDIKIGVVGRGGALAAGAEYTASKSVVVPIYWSGDGHLIVVADDQDAVYESSEADNKAFLPQAVVRPLPSDLIVENVVADATAAAGGMLNASWDVANTSANPARGRMTQGIYLSADQTWDSGDPLLGTILTTVDLPPGVHVRVNAAINLSLLGEAGPNDTFAGDVPGLLPGNYYVVVRTDNRNNIPETNERNNTGAASVPTEVTIPNFTLGGTTLDQWGPGQVRYYCLTVDEGLDLLLKMDSQEYASSGLYVAYDRVPTPVDHDIAVTDVATLSKRIVVPSTRAGSYYVLLRAPRQAAAETDDFEFHAETLSFGIEEAKPASGGRGGFVTGRIRGAGFREGGTALLRGAAGLEIPPASVRFVSTVEAEVRWDLRSAPLGRYDVVVRRPGGTEVVLADGFEVVLPIAPELSINRIIPRALLANRPEQYVILVTNASNNDIELATLQVDVSGDATIQVSTIGDFRSRTEVVPDTLKGEVPGLADVVVSEDGNLKSVPLVARNVPPGATSTIQLTLFVPRGETEFPVRVTSRTFTEDAFIEELLTNLEAGRRLILSKPDDFAPASVDLAQDATEYARKHLMDAANLGLIDPASIAASLLGLPAIQRSVETRQIALALSGAGNADPLLAAGALLSCSDFFRATGCALAVAGCATAVTGVGAVLCVAGLVACATGWELEEGGFIGCLDPASAVNCLAQELLCNPVVGSFDPNDIIGPEGFGDERWVSREELLGYTIRFENDPDLATAPAREVRVTHPLDSLVDVRTFRLGAFGFGGMRFEVPVGSPTFTTRLDLRDSIGLFVDVTAGIDITTRSAFWNLVSIDPGTGLSPDNPFDGFLALNDSLGSGEGFVTYTIRPVSTAGTGDLVSAEAQIVFDINEPIDTPIIFNTIDADAPSSRITLADPIESGRWQVNWSADDVGSGVRDYRLYVSEDGVNFAPYRAGITDATVVFAGEPNGRYHFYSVASDNAGNAEPAKSEGEIDVAVEVAGEVPEEFALYQGYPNPFNPSLTVPFDVARTGNVEILVFDVLGRLARKYDAGRLQPGRYEQQMNLGSFASGVYFYEIRVLDGSRLLFRNVMKAVLVK